MILRDKVTIKTVRYSAAVQPINSEQSFTGDQIVVTRFRMFLLRTAPELETSDKVLWRDKEYDIVGTAEPHVINGRLSHYEYVMEKVTNF